MPQITVNEVGVPKGNLVEGAYELCGLNSSEYERTPEEMTTGLIALTDLMASLDAKGIKLGFEFPTYGNGLLEEPSGITPAANRPIKALLAQALAPTIGGLLSEDARSILATAMQDLYALNAPCIPSTKPAYFMRGMGSRHLGLARSCHRRTPSPSSPPTPTPTPAPAPAPTVSIPVIVTAPAISGNAIQGTALAVTNGIWLNNPTSYAYNWTLDGAFIAGATTNGYTPVAGDIGHNIACVVSASNTAGIATATSDTVGPVVSQAPANTALPVVTGVPQDGQTLSCSTGTWANSPTSYTYQWLRNGASILGATSSTYAVATIDVGADISCLVGAINIYGTGSATSLMVGPVLPAVPVNTTAPTISGTATQGSTLTVSNTGVWTNSPTSFTYQWKRGGTNIAGETGSTYLLASADVGQNITCAVVAINAGGSSSAASSNAIGPISGLSSGSLTVTNVSATGTAPLVMSLSSGSALSPGFYLQWEFAGSLTPAKNTDSSYTITTQHDVTFITGNDWAALDTSLGYITPAGAFAFHCRGLIDDPAGTITLTDSLGATSTYTAITNWSNDYTDTISVSVAKLTSTSGANCSRLLTINSPYLGYTVWSGGGVILSRADRVAANGNFYVELTINGWGTSGANYLGITDSAIDFNGQGTGFFGSAGALPGDANFAAGISTITNSTTTATVTTTLAHGLQNGATVVVSGAVPSAYNGTFTVTVTGQKTFTYTMLSDPGGSATTHGSYSCIPYGMTLSLPISATSVTVHLNGSTTNIALGATAAVGDVVGLHYIKSSNTFEVYYKSVGGGAGGKIGTTQTLTSQIPSTYYLFAGGNKTNDSGTINFGASAYAMTAPSGSTYYA